MLRLVLINCHPPLSSLALVLVLSLPWEFKLEPVIVRSQGPWSSELEICLLGLTIFLNHLSMPLSPTILLQFLDLLGLAGEDIFGLEILLSFS